MMRMSPVTAVIFDMDGTLTDSEHWWDEIRRQMAADQGIEWPEQATPKMMGMATQEWSRFLVDEIGFAGTWQEMAEKTIDLMAERYRQRLPLLPGADAAVRRMATRYPIGICSSSPRRLIETVADEAGWDDLLRACLSTEEVGVGKPDPTGYLHTAGLLSAEPASCLVVEDSANGIDAALTAGMHVIAVPPHFHPPAPEVLARCDHVLDSLDDLTLELVVGLG